MDHPTGFTPWLSLTLQADPFVETHDCVKVYFDVHQQHPTNTQLSTFTRQHKEQRESIS